MSSKCISGMYPEVLYPPRPLPAHYTRFLCPLSLNKAFTAPLRPRPPLSLSLQMPHACQTPIATPTRTPLGVC